MRLRKRTDTRIQNGWLLRRKSEYILTYYLTTNYHELPRNFLGNFAKGSGFAKGGAWLGSGKCCRLDVDMEPVSAVRGTRTKPGVLHRHSAQLMNKIFLM